MTSLEKSSRSHCGQYLDLTIECDFCGLDGLGSEIKSSGTNTNSGKSTLGSRVNLGSRVESKSKNLISHSIPSMKCDYPKKVV